MKREVRVSDRVYAALYPRRTANDPQSFTDHLNTNLVSEVRIETQRFYGGLETVEARYPGLNYTYPPHIKRLSYFPHHKRLFEIFAALALTNGEILSLCRWEGTLWARQRYERDEGVKVRDTTGDDIGPWVPREQRHRHVRKISASTLARDGPIPASPRGDGPSRNPSGALRPHSRLSIAQMLERQIQPARAATATADASSTHIREERHADATTLGAQQPIAAFPIMTDETASASSPSTPAPEASSSDHQQRNSLMAITSDALRRMRALAELRASGRDIDPSDPAFEQYLKEHAEASELPEGFEAAQTIANVMSTVGAMDAQSPPAAEVQGMDLL